MKFNYQNSNYIVTENVSLGEAMEVITLNQRGSVVVSSDKGVLLGVLSDGDIRRALLRHATLITPISKLFNPNVISLSNKEDCEVRSKEIFQTKAAVNMIPVVDKYNKLTDVIVRNPGVRKAL